MTDRQTIQTDRQAYTQDGWTEETTSYAHLETGLHARRMDRGNYKLCTLRDGLTRKTDGQRKLHGMHTDRRMSTSVAGAQTDLCKAREDRRTYKHSRLTD